MIDFGSHNISFSIYVDTTFFTFLSWFDSALFLARTCIVTSTSLGKDVGADCCGWDTGRFCFVVFGVAIEKMR